MTRINKLLKSGLSVFIPKTIVSYFLTLLKDLKFDDKCSHSNKNKSIFTYKDKRTKTLSRLDYILFSKGISLEFKKSYLMQALKCDHKAVISDFKVTHNKKGKGYWKFNNSLLSDGNYCHEIKQLIRNINNDYQFDSKRLIWEILKIRIKEQTIKFAVIKSNTNRQNMEALQKRLDEINVSLELNINENVIELNNEKSTIETSLNDYYQKKAEGIQIRAKAKWVEMGEKSNQYFLGLENKTQSDNVIRKVKIGNNTYTKNVDILRETEHFYKTLYSSTNVNMHEIDNYLNTINIPRSLNESEKNSCEKNISRDEIQSAVNNLKRNKSPGLDGLTPDFYKHFWSQLENLFIDMINESFNHGQLPDSLKKAVLTLLYKKGDRKLLENFRPISLTNYDYKIIAFVLAKRLQSVIAKIIGKDQSAYIKGRFIGFNSRMILDIIEYCNTNNKQGVIIGLDFRKAFDSLEWSFMFQTLKKFNFGEKFIQWIQILYFEPSLVIKNNGWLTNSIQMKRGVRQGCPISALLFILCVEIMSLGIKQNNNIKGITLNNKEVKLSQYADDSTLILNNKESIAIAIDEVNRFSKVSGLELNKSKCEGLWLGTYRDNYQNKFNNIVFPNEPIKILGVYIGNDQISCLEKNWMPKIKKIETLAESWKKRKLTLFGKVQIINTLLVSKFVYNFSVLNVPENIIKQINKIIFGFLWNKRDRIKRKTIIAKLEKGGLNLVDIEAKINALKATWVSKLLTCDSSWSLLPTFYIAQLGFDVKTFSHTNFQTISENVNLPKFYEDVFASFHKCKDYYETNLVNKDDVLREPFWLNKRFTFQNKVMFFPNWIKSGFIFVKDFLDAEGKIINEQTVIRKLGIQSTNWIDEFLRVKKALKCLFIKNNLTFPNVSFVRRKCNNFISINNEKINLTTVLKSYVFYTVLINKKAQKNYLENYWRQLFNYEKGILNWKVVYKQKVKSVKYVKLAEFNYKVLNNIVPCGKIVSHWDESVSK